MTRAERRRQMRAAGYRRAERKRGRRGAIRAAEAAAAPLRPIDEDFSETPSGLWVYGGKLR